MGFDEWLNGVKSCCILFEKLALPYAVNSFYWFSVMFNLGNAAIRYWKYYFYHDS